MTATSASIWHLATIIDIITETPTTKTFIFSLPEPVIHLAGQHYEIRLTASDGYQAARLYSAASAADGSHRLALTIALLPDGEVSPYVTEHTSIGSQLEIRGPLGKFFVWRPEDTRPVLLIGGGSGVVPLRSMLHAHRLAQSVPPMRLLYSARSYEEIIYKQEFLHNGNPVAPVDITLSDQAPASWNGAVGRVSSSLLQTTLRQFAATPVCYVCGSTPFVEAVTTMLVALGVPPADIKAERFGAAA